MTIEIKSRELQGSESAPMPQWMLPEGQTEDVAEVGGASARRAQTASERRASSDQRKRDAGKVRLNVWLDTKVIEVVTRLSKSWSFRDRSQTVEVAVRYLDQQGKRGLKEIDLAE